MLTDSFQLNITVGRLICFIIGVAFTLFITPSGEQLTLPQLLYAKVQNTHFQENQSQVSHTKLNKWPFLKTIDKTLKNWRRKGQLAIYWLGLWKGLFFTQRQSTIYIYLTIGTMAKWVCKMAYKYLHRMGQFCQNFWKG